MIIYSHRGNLDGPSDSENRLSIIDETLRKGFHVETDIWYNPHLVPDLYLGHDHGIYPITLDELYHREPVVLHCKDVSTLSYISRHATYNINTWGNHDALHYFYHDIDAVTLTSEGYLWVHPSELLKLYKNFKYGESFDFSNCIAVLPERLLRVKTYDVGEEQDFLKHFYGICTDYPIRYKEILI